MTTITTFDRMALQFGLEGWRRGLPLRLSAATVIADTETCRQAVCPECRGTGLHYHPYNKAGRYRVIAACLCGYGEEF